MSMITSDILKLSTNIKGRKLIKNLTVIFRNIHNNENYFQLTLGKEKNGFWFITKILDRQTKQEFIEQKFNIKLATTGELKKENNKFVDEYVKVQQKDYGCIELPRYLYHGTVNDFESNNIQASSKDDAIWFSFDINIASNYAQDKYSRKHIGIIHKYDLTDISTFPFELKNILIVDNLRGNTPFKERYMLVQKSNEGYNFVLDKNTGDMIYIGHLRA